MKTHKDLDVWREAIKLSKGIYLLTQRYPKEEVFGLVSQMRRAAVSVASNIAEGAARSGNREFIKFLHIAAGSASELDTQLEISKEIGFISPGEINATQDSVAKVSRMLQGLIRSIKRRTPGG